MRLSSSAVKVTALALWPSVSLSGQVYAAGAFKEEQSRTLQFVMPHLGQMFLSLDRRSGEPAPAAAAKPSLRVVASR